MAVADERLALTGIQISPTLLRACKLKFLPRLKFPNEIEEAFSRSRTQFGQSVRVGLLAFATMTVALAPFGAMLASAPRSLMSLGTPIQLLFMLPFCLLAFFMNIRSPNSRAAEMSVFLLVPVLVVGMLIQRVQGSSVGFDVPLEYTALIIASFFFLGHLRFRIFLPISLALLGLTVGVEYLLVESAQPTDYRMLVNFILIFMGAFGGYSFEYVLRDAWLNRQMLEQLSMLDPLTGLLNRQGLEDALERTLRRARRDQCGLAVAILDIDYFKAYNELFGRDAGDMIIQRVAGTASRTARRPMDFCARLGGEEVVIVWYGTSPEHAEEAAAQLLKDVEDMHIRHSGSKVSPDLTASLGLVYLAPAPRMPPAAEVIREADSLMSQAKARGRNQMSSSLG